MAQIRSFEAGIDGGGGSLCTDCATRTPQITIEDHPTRNDHAFLCLNCAAKDLASDRQLLALAVVTLVARCGLGIRLSTT